MKFVKYTKISRLMLVFIMGSGPLPLPARAQQNLPQNTANPFLLFFAKLAIAKGNSRGEADYAMLVGSIGTMSSDEITAGITVIDQQLDDTTEPANHLAKADAANLLMFISWRQDGAELLLTQIDRLSSMINDPAHLHSGSALATLQSIGMRRPDIVIPILENALTLPDVNSATSVGPGIATILLRLSPLRPDIIGGVVQYMRRSDVTDAQLVSTIVGISGSPIIADQLTAELVQCLERGNDHVKARALVGISRSSPLARAAAQARIQRLSNDPNETTHIRQLAVKALQGQTTEDPNP